MAVAIPPVAGRRWRSWLGHYPAALSTLAALALLAALTYVFLWRMWAASPQDRASFPEKSDTTEVFFPRRFFVAQTLAAGQLPLWNPHVDSGYPQFADPQAATFYPVALLFALVAGRGFSLDTLVASLGLHFFLAGAFAFFFFRRILANWLPAMLGAVVFEFGGYL